VWQVFLADAWVAGGRPQAAPSRLIWGLAPLDPRHQVARKTCRTPPVVEVARVEEIAYDLLWRAGSDRRRKAVATRRTIKGRIIMQSRGSALKAVCSWMLFLGWGFLGTGLSAAQEEGPGPAPGTGACELEIVGSHIDRLTLESPNGHIRHMASPGPHLSLPAGKYCVRQVDLKGGYQFIGSSVAEPGWFTLTPETPQQLKVGAPLKPSVKVTRRGRFLTLDYQLLDAGGRVYRGGQSVNRPRFMVYRGDREIGSGSFEYG
jgi:hypothetical protein